MVKWNIGTYVRVRPPRHGERCSTFTLDRFVHKGSPSAKIAFPPSEEEDIRIDLRQRDIAQFHFNDIFDPESKQDEIYKAVCLDIVFSALDGYHGTILAYGQTGSGKTYTITGGDHYIDRGIIPRAISTVFEEFERRTNLHYTCYISYLEIYNEHVYDLLDRSHTDRPIEEWAKVQLMDDEDGEMHFRNLGVFAVESEEEALNLLFLGNINRVTSETPMNQASSRSHSIFTITIESRHLDTDTITTSKLHLVDLAGSERVYKRVGSDRTRTEGKYINLSLHHLEQVILALRSQSKNKSNHNYHIPYRNSMLTSVLRGSLGGNCKSVFLATLNPEPQFIDESIATCRFVQRCSDITFEVDINTEVDAYKRLEELEKANAVLKASEGQLKTRVQELIEEVLLARQDLAATNQQKSELQLAYQHMEESMRIKYAIPTSSRDVSFEMCEKLAERLLATNTSSEIYSGESIAAVKSNIDTNANVLDSILHEIRELGIECALKCLVLIKEGALFAADATIELQDLLAKQHTTIEMLEKRLTEQKADSEAVKKQLRLLREGKNAASDIQGIKKNDANLGEDSLKLKDQFNSNSVNSLDQNIAKTISYEENSRGSKLKDSYTKVEQSNQAVTPFPQYPPKISSISLRNQTAASIDRTVIHNESLDSTAQKRTVAREPRVAHLSTVITNHKDIYTRHTELLKSGSLFVKHGRFGKPHIRYVWCSADLEYINYRRVENLAPSATISTRSITRLILGKSSKILERTKLSDEYCFSIEYDGDRTLDLEVADGENREIKVLKVQEWTEAIQFLINLKSSQSKTQTSF